MRERTYLMLGCGDTGRRIVKGLKELGGKVIIIERSEEESKILAKEGHGVLIDDFTDPEVLKRGKIGDADVVLLVTSDRNTLLKTLETIQVVKKELGIDPMVIAGTKDEEDAQEAELMGVNRAFSSTDEFAEFLLGRIGEIEMMIMEQRLREIVKSRGEKPAIILQTNPDPDAIASGIALKSYMKQFGKDADIIYDGEIKHQQNRVLINLLGVDLIPASKVKFADYTMFALVDVATHSNCALPKETLPTIVIDHHSVPGSEVTARHTSIFQVGATATIMTNYLRSAGVDVDPPTAAALALGIITDTNNFTRGETMADFDAFKYLMKEAGEEGEELLDQLQSPKFSPSTLDVFARAIQKGKFEEGYFMAWVGEVENLDSIPQAADLMLKREGVMTVFVYGACGDVVKGSARTRDLGLHLGQVLKDAFSDIGSAGGHREMAAVTIPVKVFGKSRAPALRKARIQIKERFYRGVGLKKSKRKRAKKRNNERL